MFKDEKEFEKFVNKLNIDTKNNSAHREKLKKQMLSVFGENSQKQKSRHVISLEFIRNKIMKNPITKFAAAAIIIIAAIFLYTNSMVSVSSAYTLQDTIKAYNSIRSLHIKTTQMASVENRTTETWLEFDMYGNINKIRFNTPDFGEPVGSLAITGGIGYGEAWLARHNLHIVGYGDPSCVLGFDVSQIEPKGLVGRLYQQEMLGETILDINEPREKNKPIVVTVNYPESSISKSWKKLFYIDQATSLVKKIEKYELKDGDLQLINTTEFFDYNQEFDSAIFSLDSEIFVDAIVYDVTDIEAGILQDNMTDEEAATEIVKQFFEAAIAKDFFRAGQLYLAAPDFLVEQAFMGANMLKITSIEPARRITDPDSKAFVCTCNVLLEFDNQYYELSALMKAVEISEESEPRRWLLTELLSTSVNPPSGGITVSKTETDPSIVTYDNLEQGQFMKKWLVLDPILIKVRGNTLFPIEETQKEYFDTEQIDVTTFEPEVTYDEESYQWSLLESKYNTIDLTGVNENWYLITYLYAQINVMEEKKANLGIGSDDSVKVWLNGELVHENWAIRGTAIDDDHVPVVFKKGMNQILIKVQNRGGKWGFCCRFMNE